jgi:hypothetical protein
MFLGSGDSKRAEFSAEWMVNKEKQAVRKLSGAVHGLALLLYAVLGIKGERHQLKTLPWVGSVFLLLAICALAWWNMPVAELLLKYIGVFFTWPPIIALVLIYFMWSQKDAVSQILIRIAELTSWKLAFPGGALEATKYPPALPQEKEKLDLAPTKDEPKKADDLGTDFLKFLVHGITTNQSIIAKLMDRILAKELFAVLRIQKVPERYLEKVQALQGKLDPQAIADLNEIEEVLRGTRKEGRTKLIQVYLNSQTLVWYLSDLALRPN